MFSFEEGVTNDLSFSGAKPKGGILTLSKTGEIGLAIHNGQWCAIKSKTENNVKLIRYDKDTCKVSENIEVPLISVKDSKSETIEKGLNKSILDYFNVLSGSVSCIDTSDFNKEVINTSGLDNGTHNIECTVVENEKIEKAKKTIIVESSERVLTQEMMVSEVGENGSIRKDKLNNPRYAGSDPNNYLCFGTQSEICDEEHLYRIIGVIDGKVKIIKNSFYSVSIRWDTGNSNNWDRPSTLNTELNGTGFYENTNYIDEVSKSYIAKGTWYTGGLNNGILTFSDFEDNERSNSSIGYIGLMSITDFLYGSNNVSCDENDIRLDSNDVCNKNNYLINNNITQWTITSKQSDTYTVCTARSRFIACDDSAYNTYTVHPTLFLESTVKIVSGKGTETEPYRLSM